MVLSAEKPDGVITQGEKAVQELNEAGVTLRQINHIYQAGACAAIFEMLNLLDGTFATNGEVKPTAPRWALMEVMERLAKAN